MSSRQSVSHSHSQSSKTYLNKNNIKKGHTFKWQTCIKSSLSLSPFLFWFDLMHRNASFKSFFFLFILNFVRKNGQNDCSYSMKRTEQNSVRRYLLILNGIDHITLPSLLTLACKNGNKKHIQQNSNKRYYYRSVRSFFFFFFLDLNIKTLKDKNKRIRKTKTKKNQKNWFTINRCLNSNMNAFMCVTDAFGVNIRSSLLSSSYSSSSSSNLLILIDSLRLYLTLWCASLRDDSWDSFYLN